MEFDGWIHRNRVEGWEKELGVQRGALCVKRNKSMEVHGVTINLKHCTCLKDMKEYQDMRLKGGLGGDIKSLNAW